jgi:hypothetical protein
MNTLLRRSVTQTLLVAASALLLSAALRAAEPIPLPEHPRPDFQRAAWLNLNGPWQFRFDKDNAGLENNWGAGKAEFPLRITVPFPWGSALSQVKDEAPIAWYARSIQAPESWRGQRVFLVIGACDWQTQAWLDGQSLGTHQGGYTPFEFDLTPHLKPGQEQQLVIRVDDKDRAFKLEGKQGYGNARGIWQTVYLESRPRVHLTHIHFLPDIDQGQVTVRAAFSDAAPENATLNLHFTTAGLPDVSKPVPPGANRLEFPVSIPHARLWSLEDPFLYDVEVGLANGAAQDRVSTYFGMRKVSVVKLPGTDFPYIALNNNPIYLQITLDQSYHSEGFYTFPSDAFMRDEILRSRRIGLNANRLHVKVDVPRKLYWADRLGLLIMADVPNSWGEPTSEMHQEIENTLRAMVRRDFNHPAIFSWVPFNETWGLFTRDPSDKEKRSYLPETQEWVASVFALAKQLDPTRLVEDNSACNNDHVATDINSWHAYLPGYAWHDHLDQVSRDSFPGCKWNFTGGRTQSGQPLLNSECGNVWGYDGSTGDCDWSWDYHIMMNEFRRHPKICGWLYTEHHDVINEWNGYYRFDRSNKFTGLEEIGGGMTLRDLHAPFYIAPEGELCRDAKPSETISVPLWASFMIDRAPSAKLTLKASLHAMDRLGRDRACSETTQAVAFQPWLSKAIDPVRITMPEAPGLAILNLTLEDASGAVLHRNFCAFNVRADPSAPRDETTAGLRLLRFAPNSFTDANWSAKQWNVLDGLKVNGAGHGYFEYRVAWPADLKASQLDGASLVFEASAKQLFGKDRDKGDRVSGDFMLGKGTVDPSLNPNSYPMTDETLFPSAVQVRVCGVPAGRTDLSDDPADHRGILSWHSQLRDKKLREAGSYGYLVNVAIPQAALEAAADRKEFLIRFEVDPALPGGLALYGERFGRYPLDPTIVLTLKK